MTVTINGTTGINTPGVVNTAAESIATTLTVTGAATAASLQVGGVTTNLYPLVSGTVQTAPPATPQYFDFTSIPSWVKRITVMFQGVSTNGTSNIQIQLGTGSTTYTTSGYVGACASAGASGTGFSAGFIVSGDVTAAAQVYSGLATICNITGNTWAENGVLSPSATAQSGPRVGSGYVPLSATLTAVRITTVNGTDTFDAGSINILYE